MSFDPEWLNWYDQNGNRLSTPAEVAEQEQQRAERLAKQLQQMEIDPTML